MVRGMSATKIEWCDHTINPIIGCSKCSPGCDNCYAERFAARLAKNLQTAMMYAGVVNDGGKWTGRINAALGITDKEHGPFRQVFYSRKPKRIFIGSMTDIFHPNASRRDVFNIVSMCARMPQHTFCFLTKRPQNMLAFFEQFDGHIWPNLWLGVTVCNQAEADEKIPLLLSVPAAKRFVSVEPMLGPIDLDAVSFKHSAGFFGSALRWHHLPHCRREELQDGAVYPALDWVICGGETGPGARPMHPDWARSLLYQCHDEGIPFFFKKFGKYQLDADESNVHWPTPSGRERLLDGFEYNEVNEVPE